MTNGILAGSENRETNPSPPKNANATSRNPVHVPESEKMDDGICVTPIGIPMIVVATMPIRIAPLTCMTIRMTMIISPITARTRDGVFRGCMPGVTLGYAPVKEMSAALLKPRYAMNSPIPPPMAFCRLSGIDLTIDFLSLVTVITMFMRPQMKTIARACFHVNPPARHTV